MSNQKSVTISCAVEGLVDEALVKRLGEHLHAPIGHVYGKKGKDYPKQKIEGFNNAARFKPWIVLIDLDHDYECAPPLIESLLPSQFSNMCFRVAVREAEAWILADRENLANFLSIHVSKIPPCPESIPDPKLTIVNLARQSRKREIQADMVPRPASGRLVGPAYTSRLIEFIEDQKNGWRPDVASQYSDSLNRCILCINRLTNNPSQRFYTDKGNSFQDWYFKLLRWTINRLVGTRIDSKYISQKMPLHLQKGFF